MKLSEYRLLLHIGLHKTATSSFQKNVLYALHVEGIINFLGGVRGEDSTFFYPFREVVDIDELAYGMKIERVSEIQNLLRGRLSSNKINVLSEELFTSSIHYNLEIIFSNLSRIFAFCDTKILVSLRSPVDMIFSRYVEHYPYIFYGDSDKDSFDKFANHLIENLEERGYLEFNYEKLLDKIDSFFSEKYVLLYEDLKLDKELYFKILSSLLARDADDIQRRFLSNVSNETKKTRIGASASVTPSQRILSKLKIYNMPLVRRNWLLRLVWRRVSRVLDYFRSEVFIEHVKPSKELASRLQAAVGVEDVETFSKRHNVNKNKLLCYRYAKKSS